MSIIKEALQKQLYELYEEIHLIEKKHDELSSDTIHQLIDNLDETFKEFKIAVSTKIGRAHV